MEGPVGRETRESIEAKKNGEAPPRSVFGTALEAAALAPVVNDKRESLVVELREHLSGEVILMHPEVRPVGGVIPDCLLIVYQCTRTHSLLPV